MLIPLDELVPRYRIQPKGVVHCGASEGQERKAYKRHGFTPVIWIEALRDVFTKLQTNIAKYPGHKAILACVSDTDGDKVIFHRSSNEGQSSSLLQLGTHKTAHPDVLYVEDIPMVTERCDTLLTRHGITVGPGWFLSIDLQGSEKKAMQGMGSLMSAFDHVYIEVNESELYLGCPMVGEIDAYLAGFGFVGKECKMTDAGWGDKYYARDR